jgi:hypothetical protein
LAGVVDVEAAGVLELGDEPDDDVSLDGADALDPLLASDPDFFA